MGDPESIPERLMDLFVVDTTALGLSVGVFLSEDPDGLESESLGAGHAGHDGALHLLRDLAELPEIARGEKLEKVDQQVEREAEGREARDEDRGLAVGYVAELVGKRRKGWSNSLDCWLRVGGDKGDLGSRGSDMVVLFEDKTVQLEASLERPSELSDRHFG